MYQSWLARDSDHGIVPSRGFGSNVMWIYGACFIAVARDLGSLRLTHSGNPGAGKTILASSVIDKLDSHILSDHSREYEVYYYFFQFQSEETRSASAPWRSILAQLLQNRRHERELLDKFMFTMNKNSQGQLVAETMVMVELLMLSIGPDAVIIIDGVDECEEEEGGDGEGEGHAGGGFFDTLLTIARRCPSLRILLLSRCNASKLQRATQASMRLNMSERPVAEDIQKYCDYQLRCLIRQEILPSSASENISSLLGRLIRGADGMFLWAKLMFSLLRSAFLTPNARLRVLETVDVPEGLEEMYDRIFDVIRGSGKSRRDTGGQGSHLAGTVPRSALFRTASPSSDSRRVCRAANRQDGSYPGL